MECSEKSLSFSPAHSTHAQSSSMVSDVVVAGEFKFRSLCSPLCTWASFVTFVYFYFSSSFFSFFRPSVMVFLFVGPLVGAHNDGPHHLQSLSPSRSFFFGVCDPPSHSELSELQRGMIITSEELYTSVLVFKSSPLICHTPRAILNKGEKKN